MKPYGKCQIKPFSFQNLIEHVFVFLVHSKMRFYQIFLILNKPVFREQVREIENTILGSEYERVNTPT